jgi:hypothetical protein
MPSSSAQHKPTADAEMPTAAATARKDAPLDLCTQHIGRIYVRHDDIKHAWNVLEFAFQQGRLRESSTGYIIGHNRCGKSETIKRFIFAKTGVEIKREDEETSKEVPPVRMCEGKGNRILFADMTNGMTPRVASRLILKEAFKYLKADRSAEGEGAVDIVKQMTAKRVKLFIIDEGQQMFYGHGSDAPMKLGKWLLPLENAAAFRTVVVAGPEMELLHETVVAANLRKGGYAKLTPFSIKTTEQRRAFRSFLYLFAKQLPFKSTCLISPDGKLIEDMVIPIFFATRGRPGEVAKLCEMATLHAFGFDFSGKGAVPKHLTIDHFADAFDFYLRHDHRMKDFNPFRPNGMDYPEYEQCFKDEEEKEDEEDDDEARQKPRGRTPGGRLHRG